jgi:hypothetical protein
MNKILVSSALAVSVCCLLPSASAKAQELFFPNAYSRPVETVDGIHVGRRFHARETFSSATVVTARGHQIAH